MIDLSSNAETAGAQPYWRKAEARGWVEAWRQSGQTQAEFARTHGIKVERLSRWARRLAADPAPALFHPVRVRRSEAAQLASDECIELALGDGHSIRLPRGFDASDLRRVLDVLRARG
jgi:hypothetical protein